MPRRENIRPTATERHPRRTAAATIAVGSARSFSRSISRALEMSQFWQNLQVRLHPAMKVLLTGGSGNLVQTLMPRLLDRGDTPVILDVRAPRDLKKGALFVEGSVPDRSKLTGIFRGCDCIVHIAAWHGIHEDRGDKNAYDFFDLNVRGTSSSSARRARRCT